MAGTVKDTDTMETLPIAAIQAFTAVATHRGFRRAAGELAVSPSALSHAVRGLEEQLGVRLLNRTTRSVTPTEAGARLLQRLSPALDEMRSALGEAEAGAGQVQGTVRLNVPRPAAALVIAPALARFVEANPYVHLEIAVEDATMDILARGFDAGIRLGERLERDMIAVPVSPPLCMAAAGSPEYFARHAPPSHPADLAQHSCLRYRYPASGSIYRWEFERGGRELAVDVEGPLTTGDQDLIVRAALAGTGIAFLVEGYLAEHLAAGRLIQVLENWCPPFPGFSLYYPSRRQIPPPLRVLIDFLRVKASLA